MRCCFFLVFRLITSTISLAQESLIRQYYDHDTCPDPVKNNIATRKIYEVNCDTSAYDWSWSDTTIEFYNRKGRLDSIRCEHARWSPYVEDWHHFYYDKKGRIVCDSTYDHQIMFVTTYEYTRKKVVIHNPPSEYDDFHPTIIINYDKNNNVISQYDLNERGDTIYILHVDDSSALEIRQYREVDGSYVIYENTVRMHHPSIAWRYTTYISDNNHEWNTSDVQYIDPAGKPMLSLTFRDSTLEDSAVFYYDNNLLSNVVMIQYSDWYTFTYYETYKYNERGQLIEQRHWQKQDPDTPTTTTYSYNERGLPATLTVRHQYPYGRPDYSKCERYEYTYHD